MGDDKLRAPNMLYPYPHTDAEVGVEPKPQFDLRQIAGEDLGRVYAPTFTYPYPHLSDGTAVEQ